MRAATNLIPQDSKCSPNSKGRLARRDGDWRGSAPHRTVRRTTEVKAAPEAEIIPFPGDTPSEADRIAEILRRAHSLRSEWSEEERAMRRAEGLRRQAELLNLVCGDEFELAMRTAVADGELPVLPPELQQLG